MNQLKITQEGWLIVNKLLLGNLQDMLSLHREILKAPNCDDNESLKRKIQDLTTQIARTELLIELLAKNDHGCSEIPDDDYVDETIERLSDLIETALMIAANTDTEKIRRDAEEKIQGIVTTRDELFLRLHISQ